MADSIALQRDRAHQFAIEACGYIVCRLSVNGVLFLYNLHYAYFKSIKSTRFIIIECGLAQMIMVQR
jgi:hypothetical protein